MDEDPTLQRQFASDTVAGICPEAMAALSEANRVGFVDSYGEDNEFSHAARAEIARVFGRQPEEIRVFFVASGTIANALSVAAFCRSFDGVLCHPVSHLEHDEANAPEYLSGGAKLMHVAGAAAKIDPNRMLPAVRRGHGHHSVRPRMLSITQATELGTVYSLSEWQALRAAAADVEQELRDRYRDSKFRLFYHVDGARFANAVAALDCHPASLVEGVDVLSFGLSKNGGPPSEAIVFFNPDHADEFAWRVKQTGHLISKMRYLSAPWLGMLRDGVWLKNARHANACAKRLAEGLASIGFEAAYPVEANMVFVRFARDRQQSDRTAAELQRRGWTFYPFTFDGVSSYRFVCSWATSDQAIDQLLDDVRRLS